ncbi:PLP-dependent aminotransferase family protein [Leptospira bandrabouensis]|uniref:aminotransferase-like domain-containing protein n=1 Tax=Leptospira bandrabouensis TaxID=2484903 RepID=UPI001EE7B79E|nr:PLP-dependent aminotransferase family protein [Leptospira bandrabouensis]MCG6145318.1 PLP-dependent aminotransferase family protein [Leptospira bandrabouensis]MCG6160942.1 PLP-dependent aminotransferase family protein [Leptospira bandrabouensis]MCG6164934.1 PLP-dependent aminotransferase family protein [Leptospira bandrabouensis]
METEKPSIFSAKRTSFVRTSVIREILKLTVENSDILSFAGGLPNPNLLPKDVLNTVMESAVKENISTAFQYGDSSGYFPLRREISNKLTDVSWASPESITITHGSQQGLDILGKLFMDSDTNVLLEDPVYLGALQAFSPYNPNFFSVPIEPDGPDLYLLEEIISQNKIHVFYVNPSYQNPSTYTWSLEKRKQIAKILDEKEIILIEDEAYRYLDFNGIVYPSVSSFRKRSDLTFVLGSFSKILSPGFRLGWTVVPEVYRSLFTSIKQGNDLNSNQFSQVVVSKLLNVLDWKGHLYSIQNFYSEKKETLVSLLRKYLPEARYTIPEGGMFLWVEYPQVSSKEFMNRCLASGVAMVPGTEFSPTSRSSSFFRMNFSFLEKENLELGVKRITKAYRDINT